MIRKIIAVIIMLLSICLAGCSIFTDSPQKIEQQEQKQISFIVYRAAADGSEKLLAEKITMQDNGKSLPENALTALVNTKPQDPKMDDIVPENTRLLSFKVESDGTAYANFSKEIAKRDQGSYNEFMLTGAIVNTLTEFPEIKRVQILVEGKRVTTLGKHMDIEDPLKRNPTLL